MFAVLYNVERISYSMDIIVQLSPLHIYVYYIHVRYVDDCCLAGRSQSFSDSSTAPTRIPLGEVTSTLPVDIPQASAVQEVGTSEILSSEDGFTAQHSNNVPYSATQQHTRQISTPEMSLQTTHMAFPTIWQEEVSLYTVKILQSTLPCLSQLHNS